MLPRLAVLPLLASALVACSGGTQAQPRSLPPLSPAASPSPSPSPSPAAPAVPPAAQAETPQAAAEFARFWISQLERALAENDPNVIAAISDPRCSTCQNFTESITAARKVGLRLEGGAYSIRSAESSPDGGEQLVDVLYDRAPAKQVRPDGTVVDEGPGVTRAFLQMRLVRRGTSWAARGIIYPPAPT